MFTPRRLHRWLTVPMTLVMLFALVTSAAPAWIFVLIPPFTLLPFVALAAHARPDSKLNRFAMGVTRWIVWMSLIWACGLALFAGPIGVVSTLAVVPALVAIGKETSEERMAVVSMWLGAVGLLATWPLLFFGVHHVTFMFASAFLIVGAVVWLLEVNTTREVAPLPRAVAA